MKYYLVSGRGTKVACESCEDILETLGYGSPQEMMNDHGGVMPDIYEITREEYDDDDVFITELFN